MNKKNLWLSQIISPLARRQCLTANKFVLKECQDDADFETISRVAGGGVQVTTQPKKRVLKMDIKL